MTAGMWGQHVYGDAERTPVPLKTERCPSPQHVGSKAHVCKLHRSHGGDHRCICGQRWAVSM